MDASLAGTTGPAQNRRLTGLTGGLLLTPLALEGVTILLIGRLLWLHMFIGMLLLGPTALKLGSTGYRFFSYYAGRVAYRLSGPPPTALRLLGLPLVLSTVGMMGTGVVLLLAGTGVRAPWLLLHKASFIAWVAVTAVHVLVHLPQVVRTLGAESGLSGRFGLGDPDGSLPSGSRRWAALAAAVTVGTLVALISISSFSPWLRAREVRHQRVQAAGAAGEPASPGYLQRRGSRLRAHRSRTVSATMPTTANPGATMTSSTAAPTARARSSRRTVLTEAAF